MRLTTPLAAVSGVLATILCAALVDATAPEQSKPRADEAAPAPTAGDVPSATARLRILDESGRAMPGRWTFVGEKGPGAVVFANTQAAPGKLAVRKDVVYALSGEAAVTVPPGTYEVYASRGIEWSVAHTKLVLEAGQDTRWDAKLVHEVDTRGWISGDFHLHTLTFSGHGDADLDERVISLIGEGVEFAVATDHNHNTDYTPTLEKLAADERGIRAITGNEVSTPLGHFNAFPLEPDRPVIAHDLLDANEQFRLIRAETNRFGIVPVVQLNHPRWRDLDYFGHTGLDPITATSAFPSYSNAFDTIEIFNANPGWGYFDADLREGESSGVHCVLEDWFHLLNAGERHAAVGNSDSHTVHSDFAGYPRNFVASPTDDPARIDPAQVATALREMSVFTTIGPFVEFSLGGARSGGRVAAIGGKVELSVRVQAASWIDCDRVKIVVNGDVVEVIDVPAARTPVRLETKRTLALAHDAWVTLLVEGDDSLSPIVQDQERPVFPLAVVNPVWVDADGDGEWTSPKDQARARVHTVVDSAGAQRVWAESTPEERALLTLAALEPRTQLSEQWAVLALRDPERKVVLAGARVAEALENQGLLFPISMAWQSGPSDAYARIALLRAMRGCRARDYAQRFEALLAELGERRTMYARELVGMLPGRNVEQWSVAGYFPAPAPGASAPSFGPESDADLAHVHRGKLDAPVAWKRAGVAADGFLDLRAIDPRKEACDHAIAFAQTWLYSPDARDVRIAFGTDDGCRLWIGGKLVVDERASRAASPLQTLASVRLGAGWNRVLFAVENETGSFGLYCRILDEEITAALDPR